MRASFIRTLGDSCTQARRDNPIGLAGARARRRVLAPSADDLAQAMPARPDPLAGVRPLRFHVVEADPGGGW